MTTHFDFLAIGAGSGGIAAAVRAASYGARCAVVESGRLGGTCVNVGCVPKKVMWYGAFVAHTLDDAPDYGFRVHRDGFDWSVLKTGRDAYVARLNEAYASRLDSSGIDCIRGRARFVDAHTVEVDGERYAAEHVVIATGGYPTVPDVPGAALGITSDGFFDLAEQPRRVAVVGSGYIAVEIGGMFAALGTEVTMVVRGERLLRPFEAMLGETLAEQMQSDGIRLLMRSPVESLAREADGRLTLRCGGQALEGLDAVLWAIGRMPATADLRLDLAGVATAPDGSVPVDRYQNTNVERVYAIGDVTGEHLLTPVAIAAGRRLSDRLFGGMPERCLETEVVPTVIFSHPTIGTAGLSEAEARERHGDAVRVYESRFNPMYTALTRHKQPTAMKLVTTGNEERVVGCHIIGLGADEMLQGFAVAMRMGAVKRDLDDTIAIHPTSAEELVTMR